MDSPVASPERPSLCPSCGSASPDDADGGLCVKCATAADSKRTVLFSGLSGKPGTRSDCAKCSAPLIGESTMDLCARCLLDVQIPSLRGEDAAAPVEIPGHRFIRKLGQGAMGVVWLAEQEATRQQVAVKLCAEHCDLADEGLRRFEREVELAARMNHPHIARVFGGGEAGGFAYYVMEYVDGGNLSAHLRGRQPARRAIVELMRDVCDAVQHAHQNGIIHRDLKPSNIMVTAQGAAKVVDFGLAKALGGMEASRDISLSGQLIGTPRYMAPEQARGEAVDTRTDVYALGVILFEALTGEHPHDVSGTWDVLLRRIAEEEPRRPRSVRRDLDGEMEMLLLKTLNKSPDGRYRTAGELADELRHWLAGEPLTAGRATPWYFARKWIGRHRAAAAAAVALIMVAVGAAAFYVVNIRAERDKVRSSERETRRLLAESLAHNAELSAQRGLWKEALAQWDAAIAGGHPDPDEVRLQRLGALYAEQKLAEAAAEMEVLAARTLSPSQRARLDVWRAEREFSRAQTDAGVALLRGIPEGLLPAADAAFVRGLLAETVQDAVAGFEKTLEIAPQHISANQRLCLLLIMSGRHDDAVLRATVAGSLYPRDFNFPFSAMAAYLFSGRKAEAEAVIRGKLSAAPRIFREGAGLMVELYDLIRQTAQKSMATDGTAQEMNRVVEAMKVMPLMMRAKQLTSAQGAESIGMSAAFSTPLFRKLSSNSLEAVLKATLTGDTKAALAAFERAQAVWDIGDLYIARAGLLQGANEDMAALRAMQEGLKKPFALAPPELRHKIEETVALQELQIAKGDPQAVQRAKEDYRKAAKSGPLTPRMTTLGVVAAMKANEFDFAEWLTEQLPKDHPDYRMLTAFVSVAKGNVRSAWRSVQAGSLGEGEWVRNDVFQKVAWYESDLRALRQEILAEMERRLADFEKRAATAVAVGKEDGDFIREVMHCRVMQERLGRESESHATLERLRAAVRQWARRDAERQGPQKMSLRAAEEFAGAWADAGEADEAEFLLREYLGIRGNNHPDDVRLPHVESRLGALLMKQRRYSDAESLLLHGFAVMEKQAGAAPRELAVMCRQVVKIYVKTGRDADAAEWRRKVVAALKDNADLEGRAAPLRLAIENARKQPDAPGVKLAEELWEIFNLYMAEERFEAAEQYGREALALWEKLQPDDWNRFRVQAGLGRCFLHQERHAEAEPLLVAGCEGMLRHRAEIPASLAEVPVRGIRALIELYLDTGRPALAAEWQARLPDSGWSAGKK